MSENLENKAARGSISQIILKALDSRDKYGYEIIKDIEIISNGKLILKQPSLYSCLRRMEEQNLITSYWQDSDIGGKRHYYSLTEKGKKYYEENKQNWSNEEELINSLPSKDFDDNYDKYENELKSTTSSPTAILNQENLFNLNRNNLDIKKIDAEEEAREKEDNKSFFQFDFFDQNIKFVKENSGIKQEIPAFLNKFSSMDNKGSEIEPEKKEQLTAYIKKEKPTQINKQQTSNTESEKNNTTETYKYPTPILKNNKIIQRTDVYSIKSAPSYIDSSLVSNSIFFNQAQEKNNNQTDENNNCNTYNELATSETEIFESKEEINSTFYNNIDKTISWDFEDEYSDKNSFFVENDYKSIIGRLYSNSRLEDPYEKNKFHTFKEIFPHSQVINEEELSKQKVQEEQSKKERLNQIIKSSEESNIDCEDIKKLNSLYNLQGIQIKIHSNLENKKQIKEYTDKNKINMVNSWIVSTIMIIQILFSYLILSSNNLYSANSSIIYFLGIAITLSYCIISTFENLFDRFKLIILTKPFKKSFLQKVFIFILLVVLIFALNLAFGMTSLLEVKYLSFWLIPTLLALNLPISSIVFYLLLKSKNFNS